jgi:hypothetical protein
MDKYILTVMNITVLLSYSYCKKIQFVLTLFFLTGFLLINSPLLESPHTFSAFGQAAIETVTAENPLTPEISATQEQQLEQQQQEQLSDSSSILLTQIELLELVDKAGDASQESTYLKMSSLVGDEECCQLIEYTPGPVGVAGITFKDENSFDLSNAKRVVFFAKGQQGGESVIFLAAGNSLANNSSVEESSNQTASPNTGPSQLISASATLPADIFNNKRFGKVTEDLVLKPDWNRYEISLDGVNLSSITDPFGFVMTSNNTSGSPVMFSLKGVTYDTKVATDPVATVSNDAAFNLTSNNNSTSLPAPLNTTNTTPLNTTNTTPLNTTNTTPLNTTNTTPLNTTNTTPLNTTNVGPTISGNNASSTTSNSSTTIPVAESILTGENETAVNSTSSDTDRSALNQDLGRLPSSTFSTNNSDTLALSSAPFPITVSENATSSLSPSTTPNDLEAALGRDESNSNLAGLDDNLKNQYMQEIDSEQSSASNANIVDDTAQNENTSSLLTFGLTPATSSDGVSSNESRPDPLTTSSTPDTLTVSAPPVDLPIPPSFSSLLSPPFDIQPSLLPPEAFRPSVSDTIAPDTTIPSVIDASTGLAIQNGGTTDSGSTLSLTFEGLDETGNGVAGYQCIVDKSPSYYCTTPAIIDDNYLGSLSTTGTTPTATAATNVHSFQVSAVDAAGNVDHSPASFEWYVAGSATSDTIVPETQIISAVDGNNAPVLNGSSISLSSPASLYAPLPTGSGDSAISFSFAATDDSNIISGYECATSSSSSLQEQTTFVPCTSPAISQIPAEPSALSTEAGADTTQIFQVRAIDSSGNVDPSPASFLWNISPGTGTVGEQNETGLAAPTQQDPLLQQQLQQDPLLQQQLQQDPLLQQQLQQQDPLLQQPLQQQDPLLQQQLQQGTIVQGPFPGTGEFGQIPPQQSIPHGSGHDLTGQNILPSPVILSAPSQQLPSLPSGTTIYDSNSGHTGIIDTEQSGSNIDTDFIP